MIHTRKPEAFNPARVLPLGRTWYVLNVNPRREHNVAHWLEAQGIFSLVPLEKRWRLADPKRGGRGGKKQVREAYMVPLMPRIVIAGFAEHPRWLDILDPQKHVVGVLGVNHTPVPLRKGEPELLRAISYALASHKPSHAIAPKGKALVTCPGPLQGQMVEVESIKGRKAIIGAVFNQFGRQALPFVMEALIDDLEAA